ncbi:MAG: polysaccharide deacetylase family protein [Thermoleophilia bacterium]
MLRAGSGARLVALTFDDGPAGDTAAVLDALARGHAHATFFVVGRRIAGNERLLWREASEGHAVGNHSWLHPDMRRLTDAQRRQQLSDTDVAIRQATGERPTLFRPPYGATSPDVNVLARHLGLLPVAWSVDTRDWAGLKARQIARRALSGARPGAIILLHDGGGDRRATVRAIPLILAGLAERGLVPVTLPELLAAAPPGGPGTLARVQGRRSY